MCRKVPCSKCGKATWAGCGQHIDAALAGVPMGERCSGWRTGVCAVDPTKLSAEKGKPAVAKEETGSAGEAKTASGSKSS